MNRRKKLRRKEQNHVDYLIKVLKVSLGQINWYLLSGQFSGRIYPNP